MAMYSDEIKTEIIRKLIHFLIGLVPGLASINRTFTLIFLAAGTLIYVFMEILRLKGVRVPVISALTNMAARSPDAGHFEMGPVTLGLGALFALLLFSSTDNSTTASIAIYALAFGDGFAGLAGRIFGRLRPPFMFGKSVEGTLACFIAVLIASYLVSKSIFTAFIAALCAAIVEALPLKDFDNLVLPLAVGFIVCVCSCGS